MENYVPAIWTNLAVGDSVSLRGTDIQPYVGTVETKTIDGLVIWVRDSQNERRMFHFHDCYSIEVSP